MAVFYRLEFAMDGVLVPVRRVRIRWLPAGASTLEAELLEPLTLEDRPYALGCVLYVNRTGTGDNGTAYPLFAGVSSGAGQSETLPSKVTKIVGRDALSFYADIAPTERIRHTDTTLFDEMTFVADAFGVKAVDLGLPEILIDRIDYVPQASYWSALSKYLAPFDPIIFLHTVLGDSRMRVVPTVFRPVEDVALGFPRKDIAQIDCLSDLSAIVNQTKLVIFRKRGEKNTGIPSGVMERRQPRSANGDGTSTERWQRYIELDESGGLGDEEEGVSAEKQEIVVGIGYQHWSSQGLPIRKDLSETEYEENYTLPVRQTRSISGRVRLPLVGEVYREDAFTETTVNTWIPWDVDDDHPYTWTMTKQRTERRGYYLVDEKVPIDVATGNNTVDTDTTSSQTYSRGLHTVIETVYEAIAGDDVVMQKTTTYNTLYTPPRVIGDPEVTFIGRSTVTIQARPRVWHIKGNLELGPRPEVTFDGTPFGYDLSVRIINAIHARAGTFQTDGTVGLAKIRGRLEPGKTATLSDAGIPGMYWIMGTEFIFEPPSPDGRSEMRYAQSVTLKSVAPLAAQ